MGLTIIEGPDVNQPIKIDEDKIVVPLINMDEKKKDAGKYLTKILENDNNKLEILLDQWKTTQPTQWKMDKKSFFKLILWILR